MINYDAFLSKAATQMQESAIRRMGTVLAQNRDIISFAPGYPSPETFAWSDFQEIAHELLSGTDGSVLQYGPTRGHRPLLDALLGIMQRRGVASTADRLLVTTGSQQGLDLVARVLLDPGDVVLVELPTYTGAITAFRNVQAHMIGVPQQNGASYRSDGTFGVSQADTLGWSGSRPKADGHEKVCSGSTLRSENSIPIDELQETGALDATLSITDQQHFVRNLVSQHLERPALEAVNQ